MKNGRNELEHLKVLKFRKEKQKFFGTMTAKSKGFINGVNACLNKLNKCYKEYRKDKDGFYN